MLELDTNAHSVFLLYYHLVLVTKYRRKVFDSAISDRTKEIFEYIELFYNKERLHSSIDYEVPYQFRLSQLKLKQVVV